MSNNYCIRNLLKFICVLQVNSSDVSFDSYGCSRKFLGPSISCCCYNTRVITLYTKDGTLLLGQYDVESFSEYFRVCSVNDDCCTLMILRRDGENFITTGQYITVNLKCICAVKCIIDTNVSL